MSDYEVKQVDEMEAVFRGAFKRARAELGVESFGMQIIDMPAEYGDYPEHDHTHDNQEEVFLVMRGGSTDRRGNRVHPQRDGADGRSGDRDHRGHDGDPTRWLEPFPHNTLRGHSRLLAIRLPPTAVTRSA